jgi:signal transduction histidine kinase
LRTFRHFLLAFLFLGLVALEIAHGVFRLNTSRERHRHETLSSIESAHQEIARLVKGGLDAAREHAAYLARMPAIGRLLRSARDDDAAWQGLQADLLPYVTSFRGIDRVRVLDPGGRERFRCERIGMGVGVLPLPLLSAAPDTEMAALAGAAAPGDVAISSLVMDSARVEVPESDRQVLHFAASIADATRKERLGTLTLTMYAAPLLSAVRRFAPIEGVSSFLVDASGDYLASADRSREKGSPGAGNLLRDHPTAADPILAGAERWSDQYDLLLSLPAGDAARSWKIVALVPGAALEAASRHLRGEYAWVLGSVAATTIILIAAGAFLVRMSMHEVKLREAARFREKEREMERRVQLSERLGSLGLLTAGVAHEINNPLEGIENYLALLERDQVAPEKRKRYVEMVRYGFHRIRDIVRDLSSFARPVVSEGAADLDRVVGQALKMVGYSKDFKQVNVDLRGFGTPIMVPGDAGRLEQVFINLLLNAARALKGHGAITVTARAIPGDGAAPARVEVAVEDDGPGVPPDVIGRIFDPFFTTTDGTGLGLSISYGIVKAHGGSISAQNRDGGGARFTVELPAAVPASRRAGTPERAGKEPASAPVAARTEEKP